MKQVSLRLRDGRVEVFDVPPPTETPYGVLVDVRASLLSVGTERSRLEAAREGPIGKARARPDQTRQVLLGGNEVGQNALIRFYGLHIIVLPMLMLGLLSLHIFRVRKDGGLAGQEISEDRLEITPVREF